MLDFKEMYFSDSVTLGNSCLVCERFADDILLSLISSYFVSKISSIILTTF